ncbi:hypothetical protein [Alkalicoccus urumqiensis]|uniref:Uncharacterized protein n=1 Tax=Alkalicoccus urumqiensis TaxID=1548213 RepID=A0A2P6MI96_ALKUR|nr:hypothetical protein [Alkalicoccus urumqiensis]PRO66014.1 hypothetical protein C6I21_06850 [Alkalicoccus urumqiensis]
MNRKQRFYLLFSMSLSIFAVLWLLVFGAGLHPYHTELDRVDEHTLTAEGLVIDGEISAGENDQGTIYLMSHIEHLYEKLELQLLYVLIFLAFTASLSILYRKLRKEGWKHEEARGFWKAALAAGISLAGALLLYWQQGNSIVQLFQLAQ